MMGDEDDGDEDDGGEDDGNQTMMNDKCDGCPDDGGTSRLLPYVPSQTVNYLPSATREHLRHYLVTVSVPLLYAWRPKTAL
jgi:hypothetical protein